MFISQLYVLTQQEMFNLVFLYYLRLSQAPFPAVLEQSLPSEATTGPD